MDQRLGEGWVLRVVDLLVLGRSEVAAGAVKAAVVVSVDPLEGLEAAPRAACPDDLGFEQADLAFGEGA